MTQLRTAAYATLLLLFPAVAGAAEAWLEPEGPLPFTWGSNDQPFDGLPRNKTFNLPDSGFIGGGPDDRPDDMELPGPFPDGERRFLRYVGGHLVDAWLVREGPIDITRYEVRGAVEWRGAVLGPGPDNMRAVGDATSFTFGDRTVLHWKDRTSSREVLASRAQPTGSYGVERARPLIVGGIGNRKIQLKGSLKGIAKPVEEVLSGCFNSAPKPVSAQVKASYDRMGRLGLIRVVTDQPSLEVEDCVAGALSKTGAPPLFSGELELFRMQ